MKYRIAILFPGMPIHPDTLTKRSLGGSETAGLSIAWEMSNRGHDVIVFAPVEQPMMLGNVPLHPLDAYGRFAATTPHDVSILQRSPHMAVAAQQMAKLTLLWQHDLLMRRNVDALNGSRWAWDKMMVPSAWMAEQYRTVGGLLPKELAILPNGVDLNLIEDALSQGPEIVRDRKRFLWGSRFERGIDVLLERLVPEVWKLDPEVTFDICGYDHSVPALKSFYAAVHQLIAKLGPRVRWVGHLTKDQLYRHMASCGGLSYPNPSDFSPQFAETSCILAIEAMACGMPVIASARGALPETLGQAGFLCVEGSPADAGHVEAMAKNIVRVANETGGTRELAVRRGLDRAQQLTWEASAAALEDIIDGAFRVHTADPLAVARGFLHRQDVEAVRAFGKTLPSLVRLNDFVDMVDGEYAFAETEETLAEHYNTLTVPSYEKSMADYRSQPERFDGRGPVERFAQIATVIAQRTAGPIRILDYGCAHGEGSLTYQALLVKSGRAVEIVGADVDARSVARGRGFAELFSVDRERICFLEVPRVADLRERLIDATGETRPFDVLVCGEVLEHVVDPSAYVDELHRCLAPGALVVVTMPWGPWEAETGLPHQHLREWTREDLIDVFAEMDELQVTCVHQGNSVSAEPVGYSIVSYFVPGVPAKLRPIDWQRKFRCQKVRQSLTLNMLVGGPNAHETLAWSLASVRPIADRLLIGDAGMTKEAWRIAEEYGCEIVPVPDPITHGFDVARNALLDMVETEWVIWLDCDERLLDHKALRKYLRPSAVHTYCIKQHHWAIDTVAQPDLPGRLFRTRTVDGERSRFFGHVHEHPELALNKGNGVTMILADVAIGHVGYPNERVRRQRFERNEPMLLEDVRRFPGRELQKHLLIRDHMIRAEKSIRAAGGNMTPDAKVELETLVGLYREHYLGKKPSVHLDTLGYYSQACKLLGIGIDCAIELAIAKDGDSDIGPNTIRFASAGDLMAELDARVKHATEKYDDPWW